MQLNERHHYVHHTQDIIIVYIGKKAQIVKYGSGNHWACLTSLYYEIMIDLEPQN